MKIIITLLIIFSIYSFIEIYQLKTKLNKVQKQLNKVCKHTGNNILSSNHIPDELKSEIIRLKHSGKDTLAVKKLRLQTSMSLLEAKQYFDSL